MLNKLSPGIVLSLLSAAGLILYAPCLKTSFFFDDYYFIVDDPLARNFSMLISHFYDKGMKFISLLTFIGNFSVGGLDPLGYRLVNDLLHILNACLLYYLAGIMLDLPTLKSGIDEKNRKLIPLFSAVIFLVHPVCTSAVNLIWQRSELLTAFFYLSSLISYIIARRDKKNIFYVMTLVLFVAGFLAKGTIVSLPLVLALFEIAFWSPLSGLRLGLIAGLGVLCVISFVLIAGLSCFGVYGHWFNALLKNSIDYYFSGEFTLTQIFVTVKYLILVILPCNQNFDYDIALAKSLGEPRILFSAGALAGLIVWAVFCWKNRRFFSVGVFWFLLCLLPAAVVGGRQPMWEYRMYVPLTVFTAGIVCGLFQTFQTRKTIVVLSIIGGVFAGLAFSRNLLWSDPEKLLLDNIRKSPAKPNVYQLLGSLYLQQGRLPQAKSCLEKTIALAPDAAESYNNLGLIAKYNNEDDKAAAMFLSAIRYRPDLSGAYVNLAYLELKKGDDKNAEATVLKGLKIGETEGLYACLGKIYLARGRLDESEKYLKKALEINPRASQAFFWCGELWQARNDPARAGEMYQKALRLNPGLWPKVPADFRR